MPITNNCQVKSRNRERGYALIMVIWVMAMLTLLAMGYARHVRIGRAALTSSIVNYQARELAQAAIERGIHALLNPGQAETWKKDGTLYQFPFHGARLSFSIEDERGKIDLNYADREVLLSLFERALGERTDLRPEEIVDRLRDWSDEDELVRLNGAEVSDYQKEGYGYGPINQPLQSIAEFQQILGVDRSIYEAIYPLVTVHSYGRTINPNHAPEGVLRALPGANDTEVDQFLAVRADRQFANEQLLLPPLAGADQWQDRKAGSVYTITGRVDMEPGSTYLKQVVLWLPDDEQKGMTEKGSSLYRILEVRQDNPISILMKRQKSVPVALMENTP